MKVVLFCGGQGMRLREYSESIPKPMVPVGYRPIMWHLMKYYAHFGHKEFILCLGYKADVIKDYFLNYNEALTNDFVLDGGKRDVQLMNSDISDWKITFVDTGMDANIGMRLMRVREHLGADETFLANYADNVTDANLSAMIDRKESSSKIAQFIAVKPSQTFHVVQTNDDGQVGAIRNASDCGIRINGGFFVLNQRIFDYMEFGEELVLNPFQRLIEKNQLQSYNYDGFWACMDTFKEKQSLDELHDSGKAPWMVWRVNGNHQAQKGVRTP